MESGRADLMLTPGAYVYPTALCSADSIPVASFSISCSDDMSLFRSATFSVIRSESAILMDDSIPRSRVRSGLLR